MILTCPECASRYFVDDAKVGPEGRNVRCANCGHRWHASAPPAKTPEPAPPPPEPSSAPRAEPADDLAFVEPQPEAPAETAESSEPPAAPEPSETSEPAVEPTEIPPLSPLRAKPAAAVPSGLVWAGLLLVIAGLLAAAIFLRADIVRMAPNTASAYAAVGLPVNSVGLVIEDIRARASMQDGHAALTVTGVLRNVERREVMAPPLRVSLLNTAGKTVAGKIAAAADPLIPAGESRHFAVDLLDPPSTSKDLEISFVLEGFKPAPVKAAVPATAAAGHEDGAADAPQLRPAPSGEAEHVAPAPPAAEHH